MASFDWVCPAFFQIAQTSIDPRFNISTTNESLGIDSQELMDPLSSLRQLVGDKNLKIGHLNVNGLVNKLQEVKLLLEVVNFDILALQRPTLMRA